MTDWPEIAARLDRALGPTRAVGVFLDRGDDGAAPGGAGPQASCMHWSAVANGRATLQTAPADHDGCSVGSYVHGFRSLEDTAAEADTLALVAEGWMTPNALSAIPTVPRRCAGLTYVPLAGARATPDIVLLTLQPAQLMPIQSALPGMTLTGKPQCQIIAIAARDRLPAASLGCAVSRARTGLSADMLACALPGELRSRRSSSTRRPTPARPAWWHPARRRAQPDDRRRAETGRLASRGGGI